MPRRWKASDIKTGLDGKLRASRSVSVGTQLPTRRKFDGIVIGIDPSLRGTGLAIVKCQNGKMTLLHSETLKTKGTPLEALGIIAQTVDLLCKRYRPTIAAAEETIYVQNNRTAITLGSARGAALASLALNHIPVHGYSPARIKMAVIGYGRASKTQVSSMIKTLLGLPAPLPFDEADAAAAAVCLACSL